MARKTELTQELVNNTADELHLKGIKPSPTTLREIIGKGSFSTIKPLLDCWKDKQQAEQAIFIPEAPQFAYDLVDKLNKTLYLEHKKLLDGERQQLEAVKQTLEDEKNEMLQEIQWLEAKEMEKDEQLLTQKALLIECQEHLNKQQQLNEENHILMTKQKIDIVQLTEREKQQTLLLQKSDSYNASLIQQLKELTEKIKK